MIKRRVALQCVPAMALIAGCSTLMGPRDPVQVQVVGVEPLKGEGLELRFLCKLRVQNLNDASIEFTGIYLALEVRGNTFARQEMSFPRNQMPRAFQRSMIIT